MDITSAQHTEYDAGGGGEEIVTPLACSLMDTEIEIRIETGSRTHEAYGTSAATERTTCTYGVNPRYQQAIHDAGLRVAATDKTGEARVVELPGHPYYVGTLFQPQLRSTPETPHPLMVEFLRAVASPAR